MSTALFRRIITGCGALFVGAFLFEGCGKVNLGTDKTFVAADFRYDAKDVRQPPAGSGKAEAARNNAKVTAVARMELDTKGTEVYIYAAQLLGTTFDVGGAAGAKQAATVEFVYDYYATTSASAGFGSKADATYDIHVTVDEGRAVRAIPIPSTTAYTLHAHVDAGPGHDVQGSNQNRNIVSSLSLMLEAGKTYTAAIQVKADGTLKGQGTTDADGADPSGPYELTLKEIRVKF